MILRNYFTVAIFLLLSVFGGVTAVYTHTEAHNAGYSVEETIDGYIVDIGYNSEIVRAGEVVRFDFLLFDEATGQEVPFTDVWFRLEREDKTIFAGPVAQPYFGTAGVSLEMNVPTVHKVFARYQRGDESLVQMEFDLLVEAEPVGLLDAEYQGWYVLYGVLAGLFAGSLVFLLWFWRKIFS